jgi:type I restriction enzyme M protein
LAKQFKNLKPTYFYNEGETIALNKGILPYRVNEEKVDIGYLINELHKDYVQEQLDAYRTGSVIPFIRRGDLLEIMVELPPLEMQRAKMTGVQEANVALKVKEAILEAEKHGLYNRYFQEVSALKHAMGKPLFKINTQVKRLKQLVMAVASENKESNSQLIYALLESIEGNLENASNILEHADSEIRTENFELEAIDIIKFLNHYFTDLMTIYKNRFEFSYSTAEIGLEDIGKVFLLANTDLLKILLDNIVDNALRHSFTNQEGDYEIEFYFDLVKLKNAPFFQLEILYNGNPFPTNFDQDKFIRKHVKAGKTGHTGQGGYQIDQIVKRFGGYFTLDTNCMQQVPTCFNFYFPVVEINIEDYEIL